MSLTSGDDKAESESFPIENSKTPGSFKTRGPPCAVLYDLLLWKSSLVFLYVSRPDNDKRFYGRMLCSAGGGDPQFGELELIESHVCAISQSVGDLMT